MDNISPTAQRQAIHPLAKVLLSILAAFLIYSEIAVIANYYPLKTKMPISRVGFFLFNVFPVFSSYQTYNTEYILWAWLEDTRTHKPLGWVRLDLPEYFPYKYAENRMRLVANMQRFYDPANGQTRAYRALCEKIRKRYNLTHADSSFKATQIAIGYEVWPHSPRSFYEFKAPGLTSERTIYLEKR